MSAFETQLLRLELVHVIHAEFLVATIFRYVVQHCFESILLREILYELLVSMYQLVDYTVFV